MGYRLRHRGPGGPMPAPHSFKLQCAVYSYTGASFFYHRGGPLGTFLSSFPPDHHRVVLSALSAAAPSGGARRPHCAPPWCAARAMLNALCLPPHPSSVLARGSARSDTQRGGRRSKASPSRLLRARSGRQTRAHLVALGGCAAVGRRLVLPIQLLPHGLTERSVCGAARFSSPSTSAPCAS